MNTYAARVQQKSGGMKNAVKGDRSMLHKEKKELIKPVILIHAKVLSGIANGRWG
jgi:hypothetical protein